MKYMLIKRGINMKVLRSLGQCHSKLREAFHRKCNLCQDNSGDMHWSWVSANLAHKPNCLHQASQVLLVSHCSTKDKLARVDLEISVLFCMFTLSSASLLQMHYISIF